MSLAQYLIVLWRESRECWGGVRGQWRMHCTRMGEDAGGRGACSRTLCQGRRRAAAAAPPALRVLQHRHRREAHAVSAAARPATNVSILSKGKPRIKQMIICSSACCLAPQLHSTNSPPPASQWQCLLL